MRRRTRVPSDLLRVVGIDDWALQNNYRYASIVCDSENDGLFGLCRDREPATEQAWFIDQKTTATVAHDLEIIENWDTKFRKGTIYYP